MARTRRASAFNSSLTFRAVVLPPRTLACLPLGLDTAPTSSLAPYFPGKDTGCSGRRCRRRPHQYAARTVRSATAPAC